MRTRGIRTRRPDVDRSEWKEFLADGVTVRCQAVKKRTTIQCANRAEPGKRVCRKHGGMSPGAPLKSGLYSEKLPRKLAARYEFALHDPDIISVRHEIAVVAAIIEDHLPTLSDGMPALDVLTKAHADLNAAIRMAATEPGKALALMRSALGDFGDALSEHRAHAAAIGKLLSLIEARRKLVQTEAQVLRDKHAVITAEQAMALVAAIVSVVTKHVSDRNALRRISDEVNQLTGYSKN